MQADPKTKPNLLDSHDKNICNAMHQASNQKRSGVQLYRNLETKRNSGGDYGQLVVTL